MISESLSLQRVNFGPYHPSIKGMLRFMLELEGETIQKGTCYVGFTHKGIEKTLENKPLPHVQKILEKTDQNFLTPYGFSYAFSLAVEKMMNIKPPLRGQFIRVMLAELGRIACHLNQIASITESVDFHLVTFWSLNLVEELDSLFLELRETHHVSLVPGGITSDIPNTMLKKIDFFMKILEQKILHIHSALLTNAIFRLRTVQVGVISEVEAISWGLSGPSLRASRVGWDLRRMQPYDVYDRLAFKIPVGTHGDSFERTIIRTQEVTQSISIIKQCIDLLPGGNVFNREKKLLPPPKEFLNFSVSELIHHYKFFSEGIHFPKSRTYVSIEGARGETGLLLSSSGSNSFDRVRLRTPSFFNLQALESLVKGSSFSDLPILLSSFDIHSAEVDR
jgi:NADH-quinone oxidoreductase subunit D